MNGKRVLIVGGSSGIGLQLAANLLEKGAEVIIASRSADKLAAAKTKLGKTISTYQLDASNEKAVIKFFSAIGNFDSLVSTIKPEHLTSPFIESSTTNTRNAFEAKFWGQYNLTRHCLETISKKGSITLTSGIASKRGYLGFTGTAAINGAIESLVKSLSVEISPIRVNAVSPGFIERFDDDSERLAIVKNLGSRIPLNRLGTLSEVSAAYEYLLGNDYTSGMVLTIDGGELCA